MSAFRLFGKSAANEAAGRILDSVAQSARNPDLFGEDGAPDTLDGRFEVLTAFAAIVLLRLRAAPEADRVAQVFTDRLFRYLDAGLREAGVGDLSVGKGMKALAGRFYGRLAVYDEAFGRPDALAAALSRNIWNVDAASPAPSLAARLGALKARFDAAAPEALEAPVNWLTNA